MAMQFEQGSNKAEDTQGLMPGAAELPDAAEAVDEAEQFVLEAAEELGMSRDEATQLYAVYQRAKQKEYHYIDETLARLRFTRWMFQTNILSEFDC